MARNHDAHQHEHLNIRRERRWERRERERGKREREREREMVCVYVCVKKRWRETKNWFVSKTPWAGVWVWFVMQQQEQFQTLTLSVLLSTKSPARNLTDYLYCINSSHWRLSCWRNWDRSGEKNHQIVRQWHSNQTDNHCNCEYIYVSKCRIVSLNWRSANLRTSWTLPKGSVIFAVES